MSQTGHNWRLPTHADSIGDARKTIMPRTISDSRSAVACSLAAHLLILLSLVLFAADARAFCDAIHPLPELYVGQTDSSKPDYDAACTQNDIQSAIDAATCSLGTKIFITREHTYTSQSLSISDKNVTLIGRGDGDLCGPATIGVCDPVCPPPPTAPLVTISGTSGASVFTIGGNSRVYLQYFDINNGNDAGGNGGGIDFDGSGSLTLDTSWVRANQAANGAGVFFNGSGGTAAVLTVRAYTQILANTASGSGGGIFVGGNSELDIVEPRISIDGNTAGADGGGIAVIGPATANVGSPDDNGLGVIRNNSAAYGGGIAVLADSGNNNYGNVQLFTTDAATPVGITNNTASLTGGGVYLKPNVSVSGSSGATFCAWDFRIESNVAQEGAAIYADTDSFLQTIYGGTVELGSCQGTPARPTALGAVMCRNPTLCNTINGNEADDPTRGSAILIQTEGGLFADRFSMRNNNVAHAIRIIGDQTQVQLFDCLIANNQSAQELIHVSGADTTPQVEACTFANNLIGASHVIYTESGISLTNDIIDEPGTATLAYSGDPANLQINWVLSNDNALPDAGTGNLFGEPSFVDLANGDYHLQPTSLGIDFAPPTAPDFDLDGNPRNVDLASAGNVYGSQDLGAYERQNLFRECGATDSIFCDGFGP
jgi:hypothetical protein